MIYSLQLLGASEQPTLDSVAEMALNCKFSYRLILPILEAVPIGMLKTYYNLLYY